METPQYRRSYRVARARAILERPVGICSVRDLTFRYRDRLRCETVGSCARRNFLRERSSAWSFNEAFATGENLENSPGFGESQEFTHFRFWNGCGKGLAQPSSSFSQLFDPFNFIQLQSKIEDIEICLHVVGVGRPR